MNCINEKEMLDKGYTQSYGLENNCGGRSDNLEVCKKCLKIAKQRQNEFMQKLENVQ